MNLSKSGKSANHNGGAESPEDHRAPEDRSADFERALEEAGRGKCRYVLRLYVTGNTPRSTRAIQSIRLMCEEHLRGRYDLEVIDIHQQPVLASGEQIIAAPTLIRKVPPPLRKFIGDLTDTGRVLMGLDLQPVPRDDKGKPDAGPRS